MIRVILREMRVQFTDLGYYKGSLDFPRNKSGFPVNLRTMTP
jgi:hypothetical protein